MTWIIESNTRGTLKFFISQEEFGFSTTGMRNDPDKTLQFTSLAHARAIWNKLPEKLQDLPDPGRTMYEVVPRSLVLHRDRGARPTSRSVNPAYDSRRTGPWPTDA
jgi:hypothetical protein